MPISSPCRRKLTVAEREQFAKVEGRVEAPWQSIEKAAQDVVLPAALTQAVAGANRDYFGRYVKLRALVRDRLDKGQPIGISGLEWLKLSTPALNSVMAVSEAALDGAEVRAQANLVQARGDLNNALLLMALSIGLACFAAGFVLWDVIRPLKQITRAITSNQDDGIERVLALSGRGDEIGHFAQALKVFRKIAADRQRLKASC